MVHDKRIRYLHRSAIVIQLQYTIGFKSSSTRLKGGELIITFLCFAVVFGDWKVNSFFCWFQVPGELFHLTLSVRRENRPISYKMRQVLAIIPPVP